MNKDELLEIFTQMDEYVDNINYRLERLGDTDSMEVFFLTELIKDAKKIVMKEDNDGTL